MMAACETFKTNGKLDIARAHNILNLEVYSEVSPFKDTGNSFVLPVNFALKPSFWMIRAYFRPSIVSQPDDAGSISSRLTRELRIIL